MAETVRGLNIKLTLDAKDLQNELTNIKANLKEQQKDLKAINTSLRYDSTNLDLWKKKQETLNSILEETKKKLQNHHNNFSKILMIIIEKAGKMNEKTVARLNKAMEKDTGELLIVLEEQRKPIDRLLSSNREFRRKFTSRLEVPIFINDELVTFGQTYAQENGYRVDEMGILALYSKIDSLQREDHAVTVAEVKEIMDEAIQHSQKASAKKLVKRVFGKNTDDSDRILLSEKDFNV